MLPMSGLKSFAVAYYTRLQAATQYSLYKSVAKTSRATDDAVQAPRIIDTAEQIQPLPSQGGDPQGVSSGLIHDVLNEAHALFYLCSHLLSISHSGCRLQQQDTRGYSAKSFGWCRFPFSFAFIFSYLFQQQNTR
jgi:hypothetical protein